MVIINQNEDEIVNFDNIMNICMTDCDEDGYGIFAGFIVGRDDNYRELGIYKTKERAQEVLKEITSAYSDFQYYNVSNKEDLAIRILRRYGTLGVYKMPKE